MDDDDPRSYENGHRRIASTLISMDVAVNSTPDTAFDDIVELVAAHDWEVTDTDVRTPTPVQPPLIDGMRFRYDEWPSLLRVAS